jgi:hypothetical protein
MVGLDDTRKAMQKHRRLGADRLNAKRHKVKYGKLFISRFINLVPNFPNICLDWHFL